MMKNTKVETLELATVNWRAIAWFFGLIMVASILPHFVHQQFITGPIINATLFLAAYYLGSGEAILIGIVPSVAALSSGLLPIALAPMVPFIILSNAILILVFNWTRNIHQFGASIIASIAKYLFLYITATIIIEKIMPNNFAAKAAGVMMAWPQLVTALAGGLIAFSVIKIVQSKQEEK